MADPVTIAILAGIAALAGNAIYQKAKTPATPPGTQPPGTQPPGTQPPGTQPPIYLVHEGNFIALQTTDQPTAFNRSAQIGCGSWVTLEGGGTVYTAPCPLLPGVYPANTQGAFAVELIVRNSDGSGQLCAVPGGCQSGDGSKTIWYGPGTGVDFTASVMGFAPFTGFDHFEGPGITTKQNPFVATIQATGYVKAVYAFAGVVQ